MAHHGVKKSGFLALVFAAALFSRPAAGGELLTLDQALAEAFANNPVIMEMKAKVGAAESMAGQARSGLMPRVTLSETMMSTNNPTYSFMSVLNQQGFSPAMMANINDPDTTTNYNTRLSLMQPLYMGGMVRNGIRAGERGAEAAESGVERARQMIRFNVKAVYLGIIVATKRLEVVDKALETATAYAEVTKGMMNNGMIVESDYLSAMVRVAEIEEMKLKAENDIALARAGLLTVMGAAQSREFDVDPAALEDIACDKDMEFFIAAALADRPDLKALDNAVKATEYAAAAARGDAKPKLFLFGNTDLDNSSFRNNDGESWFFGVGMNVSVFDGGYLRRKTSQATAQMNEMKWRREQLRQGIELEVRQAFNDMQTARKQMEVAERAVAHAAESYNIVKNRYENGLAINVEALAAETARTEAETRRLYALYQFVVGVERLKLAAGAN